MVILIRKIKHQYIYIYICIYIYLFNHQIWEYPISKQTHLVITDVITHCWTNPNDDTNIGLFWRHTRARGDQPARKIIGIGIPLKMWAAAFLDKSKLGSQPRFFHKITQQHLRFELLWVKSTHAMCHSFYRPSDFLDLSPYIPRVCEIHRNPRWPHSRFWIELFWPQMDLI